MTGHVISPVTLSFGWVAYAIYALLSAIGENRLIQCPPEIPLLAINLKSGNARAKQSWLLARLLKTYKYWTPEEVKTVLKTPVGSEMSWRRVVCRHHCLEMKNNCFGGSKADLVCFVWQSIGGLCTRRAFQRATGFGGVDLRRRQSSSGSVSFRSVCMATAPSFLSRRAAPYSRMRLGRSLSGARRSGMRGSRRKMLGKPSGTAPSM